MPAFLALAFWLFINDDGEITVIFSKLEYKLLNVHIKLSSLEETVLCSICVDNID